MQIAVVTLFPELFAPFVETSFVKRAIAANKLAVQLEPLREHGLGKHRSVDDTPYGGGAGMVMRVDCVVSAIEHAEQHAGGQRSHRVLMTPQGKRFDQATAYELAQRDSLTLICGRYEGFDERVRRFCDAEVSLGDFVLTGGEVAAMAVIEACVRLVPGVLGNVTSSSDESFAPERNGLLEHPHYTRPAEFRGHGVPDVLRTGDHAKIAAWRHQQARWRTRARRPDLSSSSDEPEGS